MEAGAFVFGIGGNARDCVLEGWSPPENGFTWTIGARATLNIEHPPGGLQAIVLTLSPFVRAGHTSQTLEVHAGGATLGRVRLREPATIAFALPPRADTNLSITLLQPDAARPADFEAGGDGRQLGFCVRRVAIVPDTARLFPLPLRLDAPFPPRAAEAAVACTGLAAADLLARFESLGDNCEFGLAQREAGAEPLGLLRFASIKAYDLVRGLESGFAGLGEPDAVFVKPHLTPAGRTDWMVHETNYGLVYHNFILEGDVPLARVLEDETRRLRYLRRRLLEDLQAGRKMLVIKRREALDPAEALGILLALRAHGDNALLHVVEADAAHPPGCVVALSPTLYRGHVARFAPGDNAHDLDLPTWLALCANTRLLEAALRGGRLDG